MADYRIYWLDNAGMLNLADWIEADSDEAAIAEARKVKPDAQHCEIWPKNRLFARIASSGRLEPVEPSKLS